MTSYKLLLRNGSGPIKNCPKCRHPTERAAISALLGSDLAFFLGGMGSAFAPKVGNLHRWYFEGVCFFFCLGHLQQNPIKKILGLSQVFLSVLALVSITAVKCGSLGELFNELIF